MPWGGEGLAQGAPLDDTPAQVDMLLTDMNGQPLPYLSSLNAITQKHTSEIKSVLPRALTQNHGARNRLRDFLALYNENLMSYFVDKEKISPTITAAEHIFRKYGKSAHIQGSQKELILDLNMNDTIQEIEKELVWQPSTPSLRPQDPTSTTLPVGGELDKLVFKLRKVMDIYKTYAVQMMKAEEVLKARCESLEKLSSRISTLTTLPETESYADLLTVNQKYLEDMFQKTNIKEAYDEMISTYKKMTICREIITASVPSTSVNGSPLCSVCLTDGVTHACVPCGHTFCQRCTSQRTPFACYVCRKPITQLMKLFFS
jgi:hypothetical protein